MGQMDLGGADLDMLALQLTAAPQAALADITALRHGYRAVGWTSFTAWAQTRYPGQAGPRTRARTRDSTGAAGPSEAPPWMQADTNRDGVRCLPRHGSR